MCNPVLNHAENGYSDWRFVIAKGTAKDAIITNSTEHRIEGEKSVKISLSSLPNSRAALSQTIPVDDSKEYQLDFYFYTDTDTPGYGSSRVALWDANGIFYGYAIQRDLPPTANIWVEYRSNLSLPAGCTAVTIEFHGYGPGTVYFDAVKLREMKAVDSDSMEKLYPDNRPIVLPLVPSPRDDQWFPYWSYSDGVKHFLDMTTVIAREYSLQDEFAESAAHHLAPFFGGIDSKPQVPKLFYPMRHLFGNKELLAKSDPVSAGGLLHPNDPAMIDAMLRSISAYKPGKSDIFFIWDEWLGAMTRLPPELPWKSAYWQNMDAVIKKTYGFGQYGLPLNAKDDNPFRLIAMQRYQVELTSQTLERYYQTWKAQSPAGPVLGCDEWSSVTQLDWEKMGRFCDLQPGQALHTFSGVEQFASAHLSKFYADLTGKPVYPYLQMVKYPIAPTPEGLKRWVDQAVQCGARGFFVGAVEWFDRTLNHPKYSAPENWQMYMALLDTIRRLEKFPMPPESIMALHFGSYTMMTRNHTPANHLKAMSGLLGPRARAWFTITDDFQVDRDPQKFDGFQVLCISDSQYISTAFRTALERFVSRGGKLLVADPDAFRFNIDGSDLTEFRTRLFGVKPIGEAASHVEIRLGDRTLENPNPVCKKLEITDPDAVAVEAVFSDGSPAVVRHQVGTGEVWYFGFYPGSNFSVDSVDWIRQWRDWLPRVGVKIDEPIWRTTLPEPVLAPLPERQYTFWTGNGMLMVRNQPDVTMNPPMVNGTYWWQILPQAIADVATTGAIPFVHGKLTDRRKFAGIPIKTDARGTATRDPAAMAPEKYKVEFGATETAANTLTVDLGEKHKVELCRLLFSETLPATVLSISDNGQDWRVVDGKEAMMAPKANRFQQYAIAAETRYLKFDFAPRPPDTTLQIIELDVAGPR